MSSTKWWSIDSWRRLPKKFLSSPASSPGCNFHTCLSEKETHYPWPWKLSIQVLAQSSRHVTFIYSFWCCAICKSLKDHQCLPIFYLFFTFTLFVTIHYSQKLFSAWVDLQSLPSNLQWGKNFMMLHLDFSFNVER